jgi:hypothetical protein
MLLEGMNTQTYRKREFFSKYIKRKDRVQNKWGEVVKETIFTGDKKISSGFEGSQAVPARPSRIGSFERG